MHGQKKRRKRSMEGMIEVDGIRLSWQLLSEPQRTSEDGYKGLRISVRKEDGAHRELILEYPMSNKRTGNGSLQLPQRPNFSEKTIDNGIRQAMMSGWEPESRGKAFVLKVVS
ncbi:MAG: hypothetical protein WAM78_18165 [Candidatus Sulfotelmatobacter sp.]